MLSKRLSSFRASRGQVIPVIALTMVLLLGLAAMAMDLVRAYMVKVILTGALDASLLAAARSQPAYWDDVVAQVFNANFPEGYFGVSYRGYSGPERKGNTLTLDGSSTLPTLFLGFFGYENLPIGKTASANLPSRERVLILDEDTIDSDIETIVNVSLNPPLCGAGDPAVCVNDDIAALGQREVLFTRPTGSDITGYTGLVLPTGQVGDEGVFMFAKAGTQVSLQNGARFTIQQFVSSTCAASNENNLDKIEDVVPLRSAEIYDLQGWTVCAVVYDSDVNTDVPAGYGVLKGSTKGITAFTVTAVLPNPKGGSYLPLMVVDLIPSTEVLSVCTSASAGSGSGVPVLTK